MIGMIKAGIAYLTTLTTDVIILYNKSDNKSEGFLQNSVKQPYTFLT